MTAMTEGWTAVIPLVGLAVNVLAHVASIRLAGERWAHLTLLVGFVAGAVACAGLLLPALTATAPAPSDAWASGLLALTTYAALGYGYFAFANLTITSLRLRILHDLDEHAGPTPVAQLLGSYNAGAVLEARLQRLIAARQIEEIDGRFVAKQPTLLWLDSALNLLRIVVYGRRGRGGAAGPN